MKNKKYLLLSIIPLVFVVIISITIFSFSQANATDSAKLSSYITEKIFIPVFYRKYYSLDEAAQAIALGKVHHIVRKLAHFTEFFLLGLSLSVHLVLVRKYNGRRKFYSFLIAFILCLIYASLDETHQMFVSGRGPSIYDVLIDVSGSFIAILGTCIIENIIIKKRL